MSAPATPSSTHRDFQRFEADAYSEGSKVLRWQSYFSDFWGSTSIVTSSRSRFNASMQSKPFGELALTQVHLKNQEQRRRDCRSKIFPTPFYVVSFCEQGSAILSSGAKKRANRPGQVLFSRPSAGNSFSVEGEYSASQLLIPAPILEGYIPKSPKGMLLHEEKTSMKTALLKNMMALLIGDGLGCNEGPETVKYLEKNMLELLAFIVEIQESSPTSDETSVRFAHRLRVQRIIQDNLGDPDLNPVMLAELSQLSESYLYRIFNAADLSLMQTVNKLRLEKAAQLLRSDILPRKPIGEIAYQCGFSAHSTFCRLFQAHYGMSPKSFRAGL